MQVLLVILFVHAIQENINGLGLYHMRPVDMHY